MKKRSFVVSVVFLLLAAMLASGLLADTTTAETTKEERLEYEISFNYEKRVEYEGYVTTTVTVPLDKGKADSKSQRKALARRAALDILRDKCLKILQVTKKDLEVAGYEKQAGKIGYAIGIEAIKIEYTDKKLQLQGKMYFK